MNVGVDDLRTAEGRHFDGVWRRCSERGPGTTPRYWYEVRLAHSQVESTGVGGKVSLVLALELLDEVVDELVARVLAARVRVTQLAVTASSKIPTSSFSS